MLKRDHPQSPAKRPGERIKLSLPQLVSGLLTINRRRGAVGRGILTVGGGAGSVSPRAITCASHSVPFALARHPSLAIQLGHGEIALFRCSVAPVRAKIAPVSGLITLRGMLHPR
jgi:hypothetical protein